MRSQASPIEFDEIEQAAFLAGPDRHARWREGFEDELYRVNDAHERAVWEILEEHPAERDAEAHLGWSRVAAGFSHKAHPEGVILRCPKGRIAGVYLGLYLAVHATYRNRGFGSELVAARAVADNGLPGWELDPPAYTRAGLRTHRRAWRNLQEHAPVHRLATLAKAAVDLVAARPCARSIAHA